MAVRHYDIVAPFYDLLSSLVFGNAIKNAQRFLINHIPPKSKILIAGGGTGWTIEDISRHHPEGLHITYVDISERMILLAKRKNAGNNKVVFINQSVHDIQLLHSFDVLITPFFFDNFSDEAAGKIFTQLHDVLKAQGLWLQADFQHSAKKILWHELLLKAMYAFFKLMCNIEASHLPDVKLLFGKAGYAPLDSKTFYGRFIRSDVYQKPA